ncbi:TIM barrel protein [uncultured Cohaesibacter sp.]|uniref:TIM barrel protein n=1 Tax=uncultured Cohaesibacter sp. TaxID=1002546 RepID=UPI0029C75EE6|nr:TIM barrel protein [uncultured Cohaesibacter sp.]
MVVPTRTLDVFFPFAKAQGIGYVEIRNDIEINPLALGIAAADVKIMAENANVEILSINALQRFNEWNDERQTQAIQLIDYAAVCGAKGLVMCPVNDHDYGKSEDELAANLRQSLTALKPLLKDKGVIGLVEPLGFPQCSLRFKADAVAAINDVDGEGVFRLVHDTFHHHLAGESALFPAETGLMHISGVEDPSLEVADMLDDHRLLVGPKDRLGNIEQIRAMIEKGYRGPVSFEPFATEIHQLADPALALKQSIEHIEASL